MKERPNLLWIMTDQQRRDSIGAYGNPAIKTPNLDRLAEGGVRFNQCYIATSPCSPSRASLLTGLYAHTHGVVVNNIVLPEDVPSLGNTLKAAGYRAAWVGKWHLGPTDSPKHGFTDKWVDHARSYRDYLERVGLLQAFPERRGGSAWPRGVRYGRSPVPEEHFLETFLAREAISFLEESGSQPFCLAVSFRAPHPPVTPPEPWYSMYPRDKVPLPANFHDDMENKPLWQRQRRTGRMDSGRRGARKWEGTTFPKSRVLAEWTEEEWREIIALYYGFVSYVDNWTGKVLEALDRQGLTDNTIVLYTTDHGDMMGSHGLITKSYIYDEDMRVPLVMRYPPLIKPGTATDALVSNVDVFPTLLEMMGVKVPRGVQGRSFLPVLEGEAQPHRDAAFMEVASRGIKAVRTGRWKYTVNWRPRDLDELYDMENDPLELRNLATDPEHADACERLRKRILDWMRETRDPELEQFMEATKHPPRRP